MAVYPCASCIYRNNKWSDDTCYTCRESSNYHPFKDEVIKIKERNMNKSTNIYTGVLQPMEPAYVTYMGRTFKTRDIVMCFGSTNTYETLQLEVTASPTNLVESFGPTPQIKDVIFNPPATIVFWDDGSKTVVRAQGDDAYDPEKGIAMAISKKILGNKYDYYHTFKKYLKKWNKQAEVKEI